MKQTFEISFLCRESKANRFGNAPIELGIVINGKRTYIRTQRKCKPAEFKRAMQGKGFQEIQEYCLTVRRKIDALHLEMMQEDIPLTAENLKEYIKRGCAKQVYTLGDLYFDYTSLLDKRKGIDLSLDTYNRYIKSMDMFKRENNLMDSTPAKAISLQHFLNYQATLNRTLDPATSCNYLQKIKTIFKFAFETGKIPSNPAYGLKIDKGIKDTILYLTQEELQKIKDKKFSSDRLQQIADVFLFSCYTGLAYADIKILQPEDYKTNQYGYIYIEKQRIKTGVKFCAILFDDAKSIAEKYNYQLPVKSNQKTNDYLKEVATLCDIDKELHFHMARHTAAAYLLNHRPAVPNETIMRIMGWKNEKQLRHYASMLNSTLFEDIEKAFGEGKEEKGKSTPPALSMAEIADLEEQLGIM